MSKLTRSYLLSILCSLILLVGSAGVANAQLTVTTGYTAAQLVNKLVGAGVITLNPTMTCDTAARGEFNTVTSNLGLECGVILSSGRAKTIGTSIGANIVTGTANTNFASTSFTAAGDADLTALAGQPTHDACILQFDFIPSGDTIRFNYVFGSEEYTGYTCTDFNDVFGFLISGPGYATPTNIALVPGTNVPVCINSVNGGVPTGSGTIATCNAVGPGSPFPAYYVNNLAGTTVVYDGFTTVLQAKAHVTPCDTFHLKLGVADAFDWVLDSGVFLEAGSLSSIPSAALTAVGLGSLPYAIRGCAPGHIDFTTSTTSCTPTIIKFLISGTAINGTDYATIADSVIIPPFGTSASVNINPLPVTPSGPKTVILTVLKPDHCDPTLLVPDPTETATLTIYDSFHLHIITNDTSICRGENVSITTQPDSVFGSIMVYNWTPTTGLSSPSVLNPVASPTVTTTYTIHGNVTAAAGCPDATDQITITVYDPPLLTIDSAFVKTCVGNPVQLHVSASPTGVAYDYSWSPGTYLSNTAISNPVTTPTAPGNVIYTVTVNPSSQPLCRATASITVHTLGDFTVGPANSIICLGQSVSVTSTGSTEFAYVWTPASGVATSTSRTPVITPTTQGNWTYTVTASYANCPDYVHSIVIHVDTPATAEVVRDTICLGMTYTHDFTVPGTAYYHYLWTSSPATGTFSNDTIPNPIFTPAVAGSYDLALTVQPLAACATVNHIYLEVLPNSISVHPTDTTICFGQFVQVIGSGHPVFHYQWLPTAGIPSPTVLNATITPDTTTFYTVIASYPGCPDMPATLNLHVDPNPIVYLGGARVVCQFDTLHLTANVDPAWFSGYTYSWSPAADLDNTTARTVVFNSSSNTSTNMHVVVTTPAGCTGQDSANITVFSGNFAPPLNDLTFCPHDTAILNPAGSPGLSYQWFPSFGISDSIANSPVIRPITSQTYSAVVTNNVGCKDTVAFDVTVFPAAVLSIDDSVVLYPGESFAIHPWTNCTSFNWFPYTGLSSPFISDPVATPDISTMYIVHGVTENGCKAVDSINILVNAETLITVPNAFSPGTGTNNTFKIIKRGIANLNYFRIFNRWGNLVFETKNIDEGWDGSWKGEPQPFGVYVYDIQAVTSTGKIFNKSGNVTVIR